MQHGKLRWAPFQAFGKLDTGFCLQDGPSILPGNKGSWNPAQLNALVESAKKKLGLGGGTGGGKPLSLCRRQLDGKDDFV